MDDITRTSLSLEQAEISGKMADLKVTAINEDRELTASEQRRYNKFEAQLEALEDRLNRDASMQQEIRKVPRATDTETLGSRVQVNFEPSSVYRQDLPNSFFGDLVNRNQSFEAEARIRRHQTEINVEQRAITTGTGGPGLVPPQYLLDQIATFARAGRVTANLCQNLPLPDAWADVQHPEGDHRFDHGASGFGGRRGPGQLTGNRLPVAGGQHGRWKD